VPERAGVRFQGQAAMKTNPVAQIISVSTSGPGAPAPGSQRQKYSRLRGEKNPQISATTLQRTKISTQHFSKIFPNCSLNNATRASTIQRCGKGMSPDANGIGLHCLPRATCPDPRRPGPVETVQLSRRLSALPDPSPRWRWTVGPAQPCGDNLDVPQGSRCPPPNRAPTAGVWCQRVRSFRDLPTPEQHSGLCCVSPGDPATPGSLARRWRTAVKAAFRLGPSAQPPPGPLYVTSDRDAPAARPGPSRHRPARGFPNK